MTKKGTLQVAFVVNGRPVPKGSKRIVYGGARRARLVDAAGARLKRWEATIKKAARAAILALGPTAGRALFRNKERCPVEVFLLFTLKAPKRASGKPPPCDVDKLTRAVLDALEGVLYWNDTLVTFIAAKKVWGEENFVTIKVKKGAS